MLGEQATIDEVKIKDAQGYHENLEAAKDGGKNARLCEQNFVMKK